jgi:hypothetical protein
MYSALGRQGQALTVAEELRAAAPEDANAHALYLLQLDAEGVASREAAIAAASVCHDLLRCDPGAERCALIGPVLIGTAKSVHVKQLHAGIVCIHKADRE